MAGNHQLCCPACGRFAPLGSFEKAAKDGHPRTAGKPGGRGKAWDIRAMSKAEKRTLAALLRAAADDLEE